MLIDGTITKEVFDEKLIEFKRKLYTLSERKYLLEESIGKQKDVSKRMSALRETLKQEEILDGFDRAVFESIVNKVYDGGYDEEGNLDPYRLTFVLKGNQTETVPNAKKHYKEKKMMQRKVKRCFKMEKKLTEVVDKVPTNNYLENLCSCGTDVTNDLCSWECPDTCGRYCAFVPQITR